MKEKITNRVTGFVIRISTFIILGVLISIISPNIFNNIFENNVVVYAATSINTAKELSSVATSKKTGSFILKQDIRMDKTLEIKHGIVTLDLNGHKLKGKTAFLSSANTPVISITESGNVRIIDSKGGGSIEEGYGVSGAGIRNKGTLYIEDIIVANNKASDKGGGIANYNNCTIVRCTIKDNSSQGGGNIYNSDGANLKIYNSVIENGMAKNGKTYYSGGGILNFGDITMNGSTIHNNTAGQGGAIRNQGNISLTGKNTITGNKAVEVGGGIYNFVTTGHRLQLSGTFIIKDNHLEDNSLSNLYLANDYKIEVSGNIGKDSEIYVSLSSKRGYITHNLSKSSEKNVFFADNGEPVRLDGRDAIFENSNEMYLGDVTAVLRYNIPEYGKYGYRAEFYTDIVEAWSNAIGKQDPVVTLYSDATIESCFVTTENNSNSVLDLNGHIIQRKAGAECIDDGGVIYVKKGAKLKIIDSNPDYYPEDRKEYDENNKNAPMGPGGIITGGANAKFGGGIYIESGATCELNDVNIYGNKCAKDGGGIRCNGKLIMSGGSVRYNDSSYQNGDTFRGGGVSISGGDALFTNVVFEGNYSALGGAISIDNTGSFRTDNCEIYNNIAGTDGGAIYIKGVYSETIISNTIIRNNTADNGDGGAVWALGKKIFFNNCNIYDNTAYIDGGGIFAAAEANNDTLDGCSINFQGVCVVDNNKSKKKNIRSNVSLDAKGSARIDQALVHVAWLEEGSKIGLNRDKATYNTNLVTGLRELDKKYFFADNGTLEFKKSGERTEVFMATAIEPFGYSIYLIIVLELIGAIAVIITSFRNRKRGGNE